MTIKICHNKFNENAEKIGDVLRTLFTYFLGGLKYIFVVFTLYSWVQLSSDYLWGMGIMFGALFSGFAWLIHFVEANEENYDNDFAKLNNKLKLFGWNEDC